MKNLLRSDMVSDTPMDVVGKNTVHMKTTEHKTSQLTVGLPASLSILFTYFSLMQTIPCATSSACAWVCACNHLGLTTQAAFVLLAYTSLADSRTLLKQLLTCLDFILDSEDLFCCYKQKKWFLWTITAPQAAENHGDEWGLSWYLRWAIYSSIPT